MKFSIATPTRNALEKLKRCVGSVRGQFEVSLEHLVQDARSTDSTGDWLATQHDIQSVSEADSGMYDAINRAWARSNGEVLSWLNSDEQYLPNSLARVQAFFDANPNVDVVFGNYVVCDGSGRPIALRREIPFRRFYVANTFLNAQSCTLFFRRRLLDQGLLQLNASYRYAADKELMLRLSQAGAVIRHLPEYIAIFGIDGTNLSTHPQAEEESESIRLSNGAFRLRPLRKIAIVGRRIERLVSGAYRKEAISYKYALNELPTYAVVQSKLLGGSYDLKDAKDDL